MGGKASRSDKIFSREAERDASILQHEKEVGGAVVLRN